MTQQPLNATVIENRENFKPFMDEFEILAIEACFQILEGPIHALEWGCGHSALYFPSKLPQNVSWDSIEHNQDWAGHIGTQAKSQGIENLRIHYVPNSSEFPALEDGDYDSFSEYILFPTSLNKKFNFILVDGRARVECMQIGWMLLKDHGVMILHDAQREEYKRGYPRQAFYLRLTNPHKDNEGAVATVFMSKAEAFVESLAAFLQPNLPKHIELRLRSKASEKIPYSKQDPDNLSKRIDLKHKGSFQKSAGQRKQKVVFLNTYYTGFLENHYRKNPGFSSLSYEDQKSALQSQRFGDSDYYSESIKQAGWRAEDLIINCTPLQKAWARENGTKKNGLGLVIEQLRSSKADVIYVQDLSISTKAFLSAVRPHVKLIVGQIASPLPPQADVTGFDIIFTSFPHFVDPFRKLGVAAYYQPLAFDRRVIEENNNRQKDVPITFVGGISSLHKGRMEFLEVLSRQFDIKIWGYGIDTLEKNSPVRIRYQGEAWGRQMFDILRRSFITINHHIDAAQNNANNMRLFEATGCRALLITDFKDNLNELFEIGKEVIAYRSPEECVALVNYYLQNKDEADQIAREGQKRTLSEHTYEKRLEQTAEILDRHLAFKQKTGSTHLDSNEKVSYGYTPIDRTQLTEDLTQAWKRPEIPERQRALARNELQNMYRGNPPVVYQVLADILRPHVLNGGQILEIGCASGYYYEILEYLLKKRLRYTGMDYSTPLIDMARAYYPQTDFLVSDGADLPFKESQFPIAVSSCILLHTTEYVKHIRETVRVSKNLVVAHRTPICRKNPTQYFKKFAYGIETVEIRFNEKELLSEFIRHGLKLINANEYHSNSETDAYEVTYLFKKVETRGCSNQ